MIFSAPIATGESAETSASGRAAKNASLRAAATLSAETPSNISLKEVTREATLRTPLPANFSSGGVRNLATLSGEVETSIVP